MEKTVKYPIEAFALAMVLFSTNMKLAMVTGIGVILGHVLMSVIAENAGSKQIAAVIGGVAAAAAIIGSAMFVGLELDVWQYAGAVLAGILVAKHGFEAGEPDYNEILFADALAYAAFVIAAIVREYIGSGAVYTIAMKKSTLMSEVLGGPVIAIAFAGIFLGIVNVIVHSECTKNAGLWACIPTILLTVPFVSEKLPQAAAIIVGAVITLVLYLACRMLLQFSDNKHEAEGVPVEMLLLGMIYAVLIIL